MTGRDVAIVLFRVRIAEAARLEKPRPRARGGSPPKRGREPRRISRSLTPRTRDTLAEPMHPAGRQPAYETRAQVALEESGVGTRSPGVKFADVVTYFQP